MFLCNECGRKFKSKHALAVHKGGAHIAVIDNPEKAEEIRKLYESGLSTTEVARKMGVGAGTVGRVMRKHGIDGRPVGGARNYDNIPDEAIEFITGELLGDGSLPAQSEYSAYYQHGTSRREYLDWLSSMFASWGMKQSGRIRSYITKTGCNQHYFASLSYANLYPLHKKFYPDGKKVVPPDIELTPVVVRQWYIGDGYMTGSGAAISTDGFQNHEVEMLAEKLQGVGIEARTRSNGMPKKQRRVYVPASSIMDFLRYIGPCPEPIKGIYGYKWVI